MTIYGYARVSTKKQKIQRQVDNIKAQYPDAVIIEEAYTGTTTDRPSWNKLRKKLGIGDTVVFDEVSRMSRNAAEGFQLYKELFEEGVSLVFLKERHIDTDTYKNALAGTVAMTGTEVDCILKGVNEFILRLAEKQIEIAFQSAQTEIDHLHSRTSEGVRKALERYEREEALGEEHTTKKVGRQPGAIIHTKKSETAKKTILEKSKTFGGHNTDEEVMKLIGSISRNTYFKYKAELKVEQSRKGK